jgi:hypothetical protein
MGIGLATAWAHLIMVWFARSSSLVKPLNAWHGTRAARGGGAEALAKLVLAIEGQDERSHRKSPASAPAPFVERLSRTGFGGGGDRHAPGTPSHGGSGHGAHTQPGPTADHRLTLLISWADWRPPTWVDCLPSLLGPMGVTSVRARSAKEAERVILSTPVHIAVVDLGIPLESNGGAHADASHGHAGTRVLELLRRLESPPPTVVLKDPHTSRDEARHMRAALACDAFAVMDRAGADAEQMLKVLMRVMQRFYQGRWPGGSGGAGGTV